jgi:hypothetical protein
MLKSFFDSSFWLCAALSFLAGAVLLPNPAVGQLLSGTVAVRTRRFVLLISFFFSFLFLLFPVASFLHAPEEKAGVSSSAEQEGRVLG